MCFIVWLSVMRVFSNVFIWFSGIVFGLFDFVLVGFGCVFMKRFVMFVVIVVWVSIGMNLCWLFEFVFCLFGNCIEWVVLNMIGVFVLCMIVSECMFDMRLL